MACASAISLLHVDAGEPDLLLRLQPQPVLLVLAADARPARAIARGLLGEARGLALSSRASAGRAPAPRPASSRRLRGRSASVDLGLGAAGLLDGLGVALAHLHVGQAGGGGLGLGALGQPDLGAGLQLGGLLPGLGQRAAPRGPAVLGGLSPPPRPP